MTPGGQVALALLEGTVSGFLLALTAVGLSLVFGVMRIVNVAHGEFFMLGAVLAWVVTAATGSFLAAVLAAPLLVAGIAVVADRVVLRPIRYLPDATIVATIGLLYILQQLTLGLYGPEARAVPPPLAGVVEFPWFGYSRYKLAAAVLAGLLLLATWRLVGTTTLGLYMRATQQDPETAQAFGVPVHRIYSATFALGAALAAVAGVLVVPVQQAHYLMGLDALLLSFMVVTIGGLGHLGGTAAAAFLVGLVDGIVSIVFTPTLARIVASLLVAGVLVVRAGGLFGERTP
ncbi:MAG: branched-chain amino acid ABC transporter permease [Armatimonadota bacterium]|nr:branched-chain amino acid ABC transporter permease [Armatimonadota bacterium]MDR7484755.1 branched-chain amino acid ABC transporter permease [Armatimonadota bacterium]MDR7531870.1 branched-chain amino acid ABC transporter permease [Armatimonadota bacterium]MDR7534785.1 branched-chain amino acid ABC transporter permease [Armatimonadota bacterium]